MYNLHNIYMLFLHKNYGVLFLHNHLSVCTANVSADEVAIHCWQPVLMKQLYTADSSVDEVPTDEISVDEAFIYW